MTRGRRPDAGLEPSRQLLTQRAFRQRRAAHLAELEDKINRLERENASLKGVDYVEQEREEGGERKRIKSESSDIADNHHQTKWLETRQSTDNDFEQRASYCEICALHEKDKHELMKAVSVVDRALLTLSESMQTLRQKVNQQSVSKLPSLLPIGSRTTSQQNVNSKQKHTYSSSTSGNSDATSSALPSSSSSNVLSLSLPKASSSSITHLKRQSFDEQGRIVSNQSNNTYNQAQRDRTSSAVAAAAASARSAGSANNATCTPTSGDCCSTKQSINSTTPVNTTNNQQLQYHLTSQQSPLVVTRQRNVDIPSKPAPGLNIALMDIDESECCLGLFECDSNGNFIAT